MDNSLLDVRGINHKYIVVGLQSQQIDFAIIRIYEFTKDYFDPSVYGTIPLFDEPVYMILSPKLVKKGQVSISPEEIGRIPFFTAKEDGYTKYILEKLCMVCKCQIQNYNIRADDFSVLLSAVSEGKAETMAGKSIATRLREMYKGIYSVDFLPIKPSFSQCLQIIYLKDKKVSEREWKLIELLKKANG